MKLLLRSFLEHLFVTFNKQVWSLSVGFSANNSLFAFLIPKNITVLCFVFWGFCDFSEGHESTSLQVVSDPLGHPTRLVMPLAGGQEDTRCL